MSDQKQQPEQPDENKIVAERREKLAKLREARQAFPNDFRREHSMGALAAEFGALAARQEIERGVYGKVLWRF